ncbi:deoxyribodipyrimidine photo-lyase [Thalassobaculum fulvum]|uniref:Deoxyribodipyrimidine photo-lyase n=1 Tax=Thalassobaculum fulvum TaxID=1633335 RepID=A0A918XSC1_9PROT|nr:deoxyribodipyrimidine photo-lyase [Thalassobaculum fulvum]GHD51742.1 deoxyribodipyrimidine photo-lyase [Thalassobaculum fulvum]
MTAAPTLLWFRQDLRLTDNPALTAAVAAGRPLIPVFVLDDADAGHWATGGAARWWLHHSLEALAEAMGTRGGSLVLRRGPASEVIGRLVEETGAAAVFWNRRYEPWATRRDAEIKADLKRRGVEARSFNSALLCEPWQIETRTGGPYKVFTPFWKALRAAVETATPTPPPERLPTPARMPTGDALADWALTPRGPDWAGGLRAAWLPGENAALRRLDGFLDEAVLDYARKRDLPAEPATSRLSPHLHFGELGPRQAWHAALSRHEPGRTDKFLSELAWREFAHHLLHHFPDLPDRPLRPEFAGFPWVDDPQGLRAWQQGRTGYPIVDAGLRELWQTGWMHNRVRMIVASFLIKDLLIPWQAGEAWFWDTLVDADLANNAASWQWVAGCGADAAPFFRVFNPSLQGVKFDPDGAYVRRWVPELARLPAAAIHSPWAARPLDLADAGIRLGRDYPGPIVDHAAARDRALAAFKALRKD